MNNFSCFKAKRLSKCFASVLAAATAVTFSAMSLYAEDASELGSISIDKNANVTIECQSALEQKYSSLQLSFSVSKAENAADFKFVLNDELHAKITESRYTAADEKSGTLNVYIAGTAPLFEEEKKIELGHVEVISKDTEKATAVIFVKKDSLAFSDGSALVEMKSSDGFKYINPEEQPDDTTPPEPTQPTEPEVTTAPFEGLPSVVVDQRPAQGAPQADISALSDAISKAESYIQLGSEYSTESYNRLIEAVKNAKVLLEEPNATQADIDAAALNIENAIGMLERKSDSYTENNQVNDIGNNGSNGNNSNSNSNNNNSVGNGGDQNGNVTAAPGATADANDVNMPTGAEMQQDNGMDTFIVIVSAVSVIAAAAVICLIVKSKKKTD